MSEAEFSKHDQILVGLVISLQAAAMQQLGKIKNPLTDAVEQDLAAAQGTIDILEMLRAKCRMDTPAEVMRMLDTSVYELQMNYLDEIKKKDGDGADPEAPGECATDSDPAADPSPASSADASSGEDTE